MKRSGVIEWDWRQWTLSSDQRQKQSSAVGAPAVAMMKIYGQVFQDVPFPDNTQPHLEQSMSQA